MTAYLYPLRFQPIFKERPWGGDKLHQILGKDAPPHLRIGESWEISDRGKDSTPVLEGEYRGQTLHGLVKSLGHRLLGDKVAARHFRRFPLLYKLLDVQALLSLQVHPPDDYPGLREGEEGKTEFWYVLDASPAASVICGLKEGIDRRTFRRLLEQHRVEKAVRQYPVKRGDGISVPAGRVHTISPFCLMVEIQTNSDTTYRIFDWGRVGSDGRPRPLHAEDALAVMDWDDHEPPLVQPAGETVGGNEIQLLIICPHFTIELLRLGETYRDDCDGRHFEVLTCVEGSGTLRAERVPGGAWPVKRGDFILLPAYLGEYIIETLEGIVLLKSYVT